MDKFETATYQWRGKAKRLNEEILEWQKVCNELSRRYNNALELIEFLKDKIDIELYARNKSIFLDGMEYFLDKKTYNKFKDVLGNEKKD